MRLDRDPPRGRPPLRTVTEIADTLGIHPGQLTWALKREGAPQPALRGRDKGHKTGYGKVWYEPKAVIAWWRDYEAQDPAAARREYHREYARKRAVEKLAKLAGYKLVPVDAAAQEVKP